MKKKLDGKPRVSGDAELKLMAATWRRLAELDIATRNRIMAYLLTRCDAPVQVEFPLEK